MVPSQTNLNLLLNCDIVSLCVSSLLLTNLLVDIPDRCCATSFRDFFSLIRQSDLLTQTYTTAGENNAKTSYHVAPEFTNALKFIMQEIGVLSDIESKSTFFS